MNRLLALILFAVLVSSASPAFSAASVTSGDFVPFDPSAMPIDGHATMIRTADGRTHISVQVSGLEPDTLYKSHVHNQACGIGQAGGHYQDDPSEPATPPNELWPSSDPQDPSAGLIANSAGRATGHGTAPWEARVDAQSVVIHLEDGTKIACADLA